MTINSEISKAISTFELIKKELLKEKQDLIETPLFENEYDGQCSISEFVFKASINGMPSELIEAKNDLFEKAKNFENQIKDINRMRILKNQEIDEKIQAVAQDFYHNAKKLFARMPQPVLRENASVTFPLKRLEGNLEQILIESFNELGLRFEKKGKCYHGYYFYSKKSYAEKTEKVNFQKFENLKKKLSLLIEIKTEGKFSDSSRFITNHFISDSIFGFESPEQEKLADIVKSGVKALYL